MDKSSSVPAVPLGMISEEGAPVRPPGLRCDGLYRAVHPDYTHYLRFYVDGTVLSIHSTDKVEEVARWLNRRAEASRGRCRVNDAQLDFSTISAEGKVDYQGTIGRGWLELAVHSHITGHDSTARYDFVGVPFVAEPVEPGPPRLRFDGLYFAAGTEYSYYLRFYQDGSVQTASSPGTPAEVAAWLNRSAEVPTGRFHFKEPQLSFSTTGEAGAVDYEGLLEKNAVALVVFSHINQQKAMRYYEFVKLELAK